MWHVNKDFWAHSWTEINALVYVQRVEIAQGHLSLLIQDAVEHRGKGNGPVNSRRRGWGVNGQLDSWCWTQVTSWGKAKHQCWVTLFHLTVGSKIFVYMSHQSKCKQKYLNTFFWKVVYHFTTHWNTAWECLLRSEDFVSRSPFLFFFSTWCCLNMWFIAPGFQFIELAGTGCSVGQRSTARLWETHNTMHIPSCGIRFAISTSSLFGHSPTYVGM